MLSFISPANDSMHYALFSSLCNTGMPKTFLNSPVICFRTLYEILPIAKYWNSMPVGTGNNIWLIWEAITIILPICSNNNNDYFIILFNSQHLAISLYQNTYSVKPQTGAGSLPSNI